MDKCINRCSTFLNVRIVTPPGKTRNSNFLSRSHKFLQDFGFVVPSDNGTNVLLPLGLRVIQKLKKLMKEELSIFGAQEILMPLLTPLNLLQTTGRDNLPELFKLKDRRDKPFTLCPTNEEAIVDLIHNLNLSYKNYPISLYQISHKFRDEKKPKFGLLRSREFLMKDMYCFSLNEAKSKELYDSANFMYTNLFEKLKIPFSRVNGSPGDIGGSVSHEFHVPSDIGEDKWVMCNDCGHGDSESVTTDFKKCSKCASTNVHVQRGIEVGHSFLLGTKYTAPFDLSVTHADGLSNLVFMSCHGIGLTRLLAASVETLSTQDQLRWPASIAPFTVCVLPPKFGSKEEKCTVSAVELYRCLNTAFPDQVMMDDRIELTIGKRLLEAKQLGYPYVVIVGKQALAETPQVEVIDVYSGEQHFSNQYDVPHLIQDKINCKN